MCESLLTIAGTDPTSGAGIQVDLQVFRDFGFHGLSAITAVVVQNTRGARGYEAMAGAVVRAQLEVLLEDIRPAGVKIGMLPSVDVVEAVADTLAGLRQDGLWDGPVVFDPVLASSSGRALVGAGCVEAMRRVLIPRVDLLTPNLGEAAILLGCDPADLRCQARFEGAANELMSLGPGAVLLKAGHFEPVAELAATGLDVDGLDVVGLNVVGLNVDGLPGSVARPDDAGMRRQIRDVYADANGVCVLEPLEAISEDVRGTGCQLSSAILACLVRAGVQHEGRSGARADRVEQIAAIEQARLYLNKLLHTRRRAIGGGRPVIVRDDSGSGPAKSSE